jgi:hypothetical protein
MTYRKISKSSFLLGFIAAFTLQFPAGADETAARPQTSTPALVVFRFRGPAEVSVETDLGYKVKSLQLSNPYQDDFDELGIALQKSLVSELKSKLGDSSVGLEREPTFRPESTQSDIEEQQSVARKDGAKYILTGKIDKVRFQGNTLIPNYYEMTVSGQVISLSTGTTLWKIHHHLFARMFGTRSSKEVGELFNELMAPHVAQKISPSISTSLSDQSDLTSGAKEGRL